MTHIHMSLLGSVDDDAAATHVRRTLERHQPRSLSTTESDHLRTELRARLLVGYALVHSPGDDGQSESALLVRLDALRAGLPAVQLSRLPVPRRGGEHVWATPADLVDGSRILALHMPSGVETQHGFREDNDQVAAYRDAIGGLRRYVAAHPTVREIHGDWNLHAWLPWVRDLFAEYFPGFVIVAPRTATHAGGRVIDWALIRRGSGPHTATTEPNPVSDHETVITVPVRKEPAVSNLPANLPDLLRRRGLKVVEVDGWKTRGRPGAFAPVGALCHHTATSKASTDADVIRLLVNGRSDLPGPLCQFALGRDGTVYIIAAGRANHAGKAKASGTVAAGDGNALYVGTEAMNDGVGEPWPAVQYRAYVKLEAALCVDVTGNSAETVRAHKETSVTGKIDPTFNMAAFRLAVRHQIDAWKSPTTPTRVQRARAGLAVQRALLVDALAASGPTRATAIRAGIRAVNAALAALPRR